jgi:hypothetical protein
MTYDDYKLETAPRQDEITKGWRDARDERMDRDYDR